MGWIGVTGLTALVTYLTNRFTTSTKPGEDPVKDGIERRVSNPGQLVVDAGAAADYVKKDLVSDVTDAVERGKAAAGKGGSFEEIARAATGLDKPAPKGPTSAAFGDSAGDSGPAAEEHDLAYFKKNYSGIWMWLASEAYEIWEPLGEFIISKLVKDAKEAAELTSIFSKAAAKPEKPGPSTGMRLVEAATGHDFPEWTHDLL